MGARADVLQEVGEGRAAAVEHNAPRILPGRDLDRRPTHRGGATTPGTRAAGVAGPPTSSALAANKLRKLTPPARGILPKRAILGAGVSITYWEVVTAATAVTRPVGHSKKSLTPEFQRI